MRSVKSPTTVAGERRPWEPPTVTKLPIGTATKSPRRSRKSAAPARDSSLERSAAAPLPPAAPSTKLGFSFEMAFPLSARTET
jgi:hypothetical protein